MTRWSRNYKSQITKHKLRAAASMIWKNSISILCTVYLCFVILPMLSSEERRLIAGILALLVFGAVVRECRQSPKVEHTAKVELPSVDNLPVPKRYDTRRN